MMVMQPRNSLGYGLFFLLGFLLSSMVTWISNTGRDSILSSDGMSNCHKLLSEVTRMISRPVITYNDLATNNRPNSDSTQRKILLDCGGNMASTVGLFRETYPGGKEFIIHSFEIDDRLAPYFSPYGKHHLHCPLGVADSDGKLNDDNNNNNDNTVEPLLWDTPIQGTLFREEGKYIF
ncbi:uncharacterized protein LOC117109854 [Anneissia japonica]|uniref:uncharacterized protein LOC117109854 n=1 Tax=Anneissia japonica TaxID=1529436 RepID=UPI0014259979|nr:uncharacterized protein LOC117109854 [Anneissia japonica]